MKKSVAIGMSVCLAISSLAGCGGQKSTPGEVQTTKAVSEKAKADVVEAGKTISQGSDKLVVYAAVNEMLVNGIFSDFEQETGIDVELITGGTSELLKRIESEKNNPYCDVMFGGTQSIFLPYMDLFEEYVTPNNEALYDGHKVYENKLTPLYTESGVLMWNTDLIGDVEITGYKSLLNPELKGKISFPDPAASGTGAASVAIFAYEFGNDGSYFSDAGWDYIEAFIDQLDGKLSSNSGNAHKSVADGEMTVTNTFEGAAFNYLQNNSPVAICYPEEGVTFTDSVAAIVKGCENLDNAKKLMDFVTSKEMQSKIGTSLLNRPVRKDAELSDFIPPMDEIVLSDENMEKRAENQSAILERFNELFADAQD